MNKVSYFVVLCRKLLANCRDMSHIVVTFLSRPLLDFADFPGEKKCRKKIHVEEALRAVSQLLCKQHGQPCNLAGYHPENHLAKNLAP